MLCPHCKCETEKGLLAQGTGWVPINSWNAKLGGAGSGFLRFGIPWVYAWSCTKCKIITLQRE